MSRMHVSAPQPFACVPDEYEPDPDEIIHDDHLDKFAATWGKTRSEREAISKGLIRRPPGMCLYPKLATINKAAKGPAIISVETILIKDKLGNVRMAIGAIEPEGAFGITIFDEHGFRRVHIALENTLAAYRMYDASGEKAGHKHHVYGGSGRVDKVRRHGFKQPGPDEPVHVLDSFDRHGRVR